MARTRSGPMPGGRTPGKTSNAALTKKEREIAKALSLSRRVWTLELSASELMALCDVVAHYLTMPGHSEVYVDITNGALETTPEQLLQRLMGLTAETRGLTVSDGK